MECLLERTFASKYIFLKLLLLVSLPLVKLQLSINLRSTRPIERSQLCFNTLKIYVHKGYLKICNQNKQRRLLLAPEKPLLQLWRWCSRVGSRALLEIQVENMHSALTSTLIYIQFLIFPGTRHQACTRVYNAWSAASSYSRVLFFWDVFLIRFFLLLTNFNVISNREASELASPTPSALPRQVVRATAYFYCILFHVLRCAPVAELRGSVLMWVCAYHMMITALTSSRVLCRVCIALVVVLSWNFS